MRDVHDALSVFARDLKSGKVRLVSLQKSYVAAFGKYRLLTEELNRVLPQPKPNEHQ